MRLKTRTELIPCYKVPVMFPLLSSFCIWTKYSTYINHLTSNNIIYCCKSHSEFMSLENGQGQNLLGIIISFPHIIYYITYNMTFILISNFRDPTGPGKSWDLLIFMKNFGKVLEFWNFTQYLFGEFSFASSL